MSGYKGVGGVNGSSNVEVQNRYLVDLGLCHTIIPKENADQFSVERGYYFYLRHSTKEKSRDSYGRSTSGFEIYIHPEHEVLTEDPNDYMDFLYLESTEEVLVTLNLQTYSRVSTSQDPCSADYNYSRSKCEEKCYHNYVAQEVGCTTLWLRNLDQEYPRCSDSSSVSNIIALLRNEVVRKKVVRQCNCTSRCNNTVYTYQIESRREADKLFGGSSSVSLYFTTNLITHLCEVISYDWNIFLADVGGSLGFLLGLSVIGVIGVMEEIMNLILQRKNNKEIKQSDGKNNDEKPVEGQNLKNIMEYMANCEMREHEEQKQKKI